MWTLQQLNPRFPGIGAVHAERSAIRDVFDDFEHRCTAAINLTYPGIGNRYGDIPESAADGNASTTLCSFLSSGMLAA